MFSLIATSALVAVASAASVYHPAPAPVYHAAPAPAPAYHAAPAPAPAPYSYGYGVDDGYSGAHFSAKANDDGKAVTGSYSVSYDHI